MKTPAAFQPVRRSVSLREVVGVALATGLIWLFAEAETVTQTSAPSVIRFIAPENSQRLVRVGDAAFTGSVDVTLQGSRSAVDRATATLAKGVIVSLGSAGVPMTPGTHLIALDSVIQGSGVLQHSGVVVTATDPSAVSLVVEERATLHDVPILLDAPEVELQDAPLLEPSRADISGPRAVIDRFRAAGADARLLARPSAEAIADIPQGQSRRIDARLMLPEGYDGARQVTITPDVIAVTLNVRSVISSIELPLAPVHVLLPPPELARWEVTVDPPFLSDLTLSGPGWLIERIREGVLPVKGVVELTSEALESGVASARVEFPLLPDSVTVETATRDVRLTIRRVERANGAEPADPPQDD